MDIAGRSKLGLLPSLCLGLRKSAATCEERGHETIPAYLQNGSRDHSVFVFRPWLHCLYNFYRRLHAKTGDGSDYRVYRMGGHRPGDYAFTLCLEVRFCKIFLRGTTGDDPFRNVHRHNTSDDVAIRNRITVIGYIVWIIGLHGPRSRYKFQPEKLARTLLGRGHKLVYDPFFRGPDHWSCRRWFGW